MFHRRMPKEVMRVGSRRTAPKVFPLSFICILALVIWLSLSWADEPIYHSELIFSLEKWHNHASSIAELPNGDLLVAWYRGSGEHEANDVRIMGARKVH